MWIFTYGGGGIRFIVGFQPLVVISPIASSIRWCMQLYACELMWTCLVWAERSTPDSFWMPSHLFNSATSEQKWMTQTIYTDSEPSSRLPNSLMPSAKLRSANLPVFWCDVVGGQTTASRTPSGRSNHCATQGRFSTMDTFTELLARLRFEILNWEKNIEILSVHHMARRSSKL